MNLAVNYQDLLKSEEEVKQARAQEIDPKLEEHIKGLKRETWIKHPATQEFLEELNSNFQQEFDLVLEKASKPEITDNQLRLKLVELYSIRKTLNQLKYGI